MRGRSSGKTAPPRYPCFPRESEGAIINQEQASWPAIELIGFVMRRTRKFRLQKQH